MDFKKTKMNLATKFALALGIILVVASVISGLLLMPVIKNKVFQTDYETLFSKERIVTSVINEDEVKMLQYVEDVQSLSPLFRSAFEFTDYLRNYSKTFDISNIALLNLKSEVVFSLRDVKYNHESELKAISNALNGENSYVKTVADYDVMFTSTGKVTLLGKEYIVLFQKEISDNEYLSRIAEETGTTITLFLNDMRIGTSNKDENGNYLFGNFNNREVLDVVYNKGEQYHGEVDIQGNTFLAIYRPYRTDNPNEKLMLFVGTNVDHVNYVSASISTNVVIVFIICLILATLVVILILRKLVIKPVKKILGIFNSILLDDGTIDLSLSVESSSNDEIGEMESAIDRFLEAQRDFIFTVQTTGHELENAAEELAASAQQAAGASSQISANIMSVKGSVDKQNEALGAVRGVLDRSIEGINGLDKLIENQSAGIIESSASIEEMVGNISSVSNSINKMTGEYNNLMQITNNAKTRQDEVFAQVSKMAQQSEQLAMANDVISQIASQTNLLAMNAAIEAAHAGEAGKGFAVVAAEIRKLAESSSEQSKSIKTELDKITAVISAVVDSTSTSRREFEDITDKVASTNRLVNEISNAMMEQEDASKQILVALHDMNDSTSNVQSTSKDMSSNVIHVKTESDKLEMVANVVSGSMDEMSAGITEITNAAHTVSEKAVETREQIVQLDKLIDTFKLS